MTSNRTFTFRSTGTGFYTWWPQLEINSGASYPQRRQITLATYQRFVRLANSGKYNVTIAVDDTPAWTLERKPDSAPAAETQLLMRVWPQAYTW